MKLKDFMLNDITSVLENEKVDRVIKILSRQHLTGVPVVDGNFKVTGFISENDIIKSTLPSYFMLLQTVSFIPDMSQFIKNLEKIKEKFVYNTGCR
jgi:CBS domain-containing protein